MANVIWGKRPGVVPGRRHHPVISMPPESDLTQAPAPSTVSDLDEAQRRLSAEANALGLALVHRGIDEVVDRFDIVINPTATQNLVTFTTPNNLVCKITELAVYCSEPGVAMGLGVGWRLTVNGGEVPYVGSNWAVYPYFPFAFGDLGNPVEIEPVWVQAGQTIAIELIVAAGFDVNVHIAGRLRGRLYKPATPYVGQGD